MQRSQLSLIVFFAAAAAPWARADTVSATPGHFTGVIHFNAPVVPYAMTIDARDVTNTYTAHADATQGGAGCPAGSPDWCYDITVESKLANSYYLRPIAWLNSPPSAAASRAPFPPFGPYAIAEKATVAKDLPTRPVWSPAPSR